MWLLSTEKKSKFGFIKFIQHSYETVTVKKTYVLRLHTDMNCLKLSPLLPYIKPNKRGFFFLYFPLLSFTAEQHHFPEFPLFLQQFTRFLITWCLFLPFEFFSAFSPLSVIFQLELDCAREKERESCAEVEKRKNTAATHALCWSFIKGRGCFFTNHRCKKCLWCLFDFLS